MKVLIVGAGPTGLTLAVELARHGIIADIVDKRDSASGFSRAVGILPKSLQLLEKAGVTKRLIEEGMAVREVNLFNETGKIAQIDLKPKTVKFGYDFILGLAQDRTENILRDIFESNGGKVQYSCSFESLKVGKKGALVKLSDGSRHYDYVIGADGVASNVRTQMDIEFVGYDLPEVWSIADVDSKQWPYRKIFGANLLSNGQMVVVVPIEEYRYRVISNTPDALKSLIEPLKIDNIHRQGQFYISIRQAKTYRKECVFLAGDAAHCHSPVGGRGMNVGIADACDLAEKLAKGGLENYTKDRHAEGAAIIQQTERVRKLLVSDGWARRLLLRRIIPTAMMFSAVQQRFSQLALYGDGG